MLRRTSLFLLSSMILIGCPARDDGDDGGDDKVCLVRMDDSFNEFTTFFTVTSSQTQDALDFTIVDEGKSDTIEAHFDGRDQPLETRVGVPDDSLNDIVMRYQSMATEFATTGMAYDGYQLTYTLLPGAQCSEDEFVMIHFFVIEWLYFG